MDNKIAIFEAGGRQFFVTVGAVIRMLSIPKDSKIGDSIKFDKVLLVDDGSNTTVGSPYVKGAKVSGVIEKMGRDKKISVIRFRAKTNYKRNYGYRQSYCTIRVKEIA